MPLVPGTRLGAYEIVGLIGARRLQRDLGSTHGVHSAVTAPLALRRRVPWLSVAIGAAAIVLLLVGVNLWRARRMLPPC